MKVGDSFPLQIGKSPSQMVTITYIGLYSVQVRDETGRIHTLKKSAAKNKFKRLSEKRKKTRKKKKRSKISQIAQVLNWDEEHVESFIADVRKRVRASVSHKTILDVIREIRATESPMLEFPTENRVAFMETVVLRIQRRQELDQKKSEERKKEKERKLQKQREKQQKLRQLEIEATKLAKCEDWEKVTEICLAWIQLSPEEDLNPLSRLAWALLNLNQLEQAKKLYKNILSRPKLHPSDITRIEHLILEIEAKQGTTSGVSSSEDLGLTDQLSEAVPDLSWISRLLHPDLDNGEIWVNQRYLANIVQVLLKQGYHFEIPVLKDFGRQCWIEIKTNRRYQVPSQGRAEILASRKLSDLINLKSVRFVQEGIEAPEVRLRFEFGDPCAIGILKVTNDGRTEGFHKSSGSDLFASVVEAIALAYYRDLVVPYGIASVWQRRDDVSKIKTSRSIKTSQFKKARELSRTTNVSTSKRQFYELKEWYHAQERARHHVTGHIRWVGQHFNADFEKKQQAREAGVELPPGYTWVTEHERGNQQGDDEIRLVGIDLADRTKFLPPERATYELDKLLS